MGDGAVGVEHRAVLERRGRLRHGVGVVDLAERDVAVLVARAVGDLRAVLVGHAELEAAQAVRAVHGLAGAQLDGSTRRDVGVREHHTAGQGAVGGIGPDLLRLVAVEVVVRLEVVGAVARARHREAHHVGGGVVGDAAAHGAVLGGSTGLVVAGAGGELGDVVRVGALAGNLEAVERHLAVGARGAAAHAHKRAVGAGRGHEVGEGDAGQVGAGGGKRGLPGHGRPHDLVGLVGVRERDRRGKVLGVERDGGGLLGPLGGIGNVGHGGAQVALAVVAHEHRDVVVTAVVRHAEGRAALGLHLAQGVGEERLARAVLRHRRLGKVAHLIHQAEVHGAARGLIACRHDRRGLGGVVRVGLGAGGRKREAEVAAGEIGALGQALHVLGSIHRHGGLRALEIGVLEGQARLGGALGIHDGGAEGAVRVVAHHDFHGVGGCAGHRGDARRQAALPRGLADLVGKVEGAVLAARHGGIAVGDVGGVLGGRGHERVADLAEGKGAGDAVGTCRVEGGCHGRSGHGGAGGVGHAVGLAGGEGELALRRVASGKRLGGRDRGLTVAAERARGAVDVGEGERPLDGVALRVDEGGGQAALAVVGHPDREVVARGAARRGGDARRQQVLVGELPDGVVDEPLLALDHHAGVTQLDGLVQDLVVVRQGVGGGGEPCGIEGNGAGLAVGGGLRRAREHGALVIGALGRTARSDGEAELAVGLVAAEQGLRGAQVHRRAGVGVAVGVGEVDMDGIVGRHAARVAAGRTRLVHRRELAPAAREVVGVGQLADLVGKALGDARDGDGLVGLKRHLDDVAALGVHAGLHGLGSVRHRVAVGVGELHRIRAAHLRGGPRRVGQDQLEGELGACIDARVEPAAPSRGDGLGDDEAGGAHHGGRHGVGADGGPVAHLDAGGVVGRARVHGVTGNAGREGDAALLAGLGLEGPGEGLDALAVGHAAEGRALGAGGAALDVGKAGGQHVGHGDDGRRVLVVGVAHLIGEHVAHLDARGDVGGEHLAIDRVARGVGSVGAMAAHAHGGDVLDGRAGHALAHAHLESRLDRGAWGHGAHVPGEDAALVGEEVALGRLPGDGESGAALDELGARGHDVAEDDILSVDGARVGPGDAVGEHVARRHGLAIDALPVLENLLDGGRDGEAVDEGRLSGVGGDGTTGRDALAVGVDGADRAEAGLHARLKHAVGAADRQPLHERVRARREVEGAVGGNAAAQLVAMHVLDGRAVGVEEPVGVAAGELSARGRVGQAHGEGELGVGGRGRALRGLDRLGHGERPGAHDGAGNDVRVDGGLGAHLDGGGVVGGACGHGRLAHADGEGHGAARIGLLGAERPGDGLAVGGKRGVVGGAHEVEARGQSVGHGDVGHGAREVRPADGVGELVAHPRVARCAPRALAHRLADGAVVGGVGGDGGAVGADLQIGGVVHDIHVRDLGVHLHAEGHGDGRTRVNLAERPGERAGIVGGDGRARSICAGRAFHEGRARRHGVGEPHVAHGIVARVRPAHAVLEHRAGSHEAAVVVGGHLAAHRAVDGLGGTLGHGVGAGDVDGGAALGDGRRVGELRAFGPKGRGRHARMVGQRTARASRHAVDVPLDGGGAVGVVPHRAGGVLGVGHLGVVHKLKACRQRVGHAHGAAVVLGGVGPLHLEGQGVAHAHEPAVEQGAVGGIDVLGVVGLDRRGGGVRGEGGAVLADLDACRVVHAGEGVARHTHLEGHGAARGLGLAEVPGEGAVLPEREHAVGGSLAVRQGRALDELGAGGHGVTHHDLCGRGGVGPGHGVGEHVAHLHRGIAVGGGVGVGAVGACHGLDGGRVLVDEVGGHVGVGVDGARGRRGVGRHDLRPAAEGRFLAHGVGGALRQAVDLEALAGLERDLRVAAGVKLDLADGALAVCVVGHRGEHAAQGRFVGADERDVEHELGVGCRPCALARDALGDVEAARVHLDVGRGVRADAGVVAHLHRGGVGGEALGRLDEAVLVELLPEGVLVHRGGYLDLAGLTGGPAHELPGQQSRAVLVRGDGHGAGVGALICEAGGEPVGDHDVCALACQVSGGDGELHLVAEPEALRVRGDRLAGHRVAHGVGGDACVVGVYLCGVAHHAAARGEALGAERVGDLHLEGNRARGGGRNRLVLSAEGPGEGAGLLVEAELVLRGGRAVHLGRPRHVGAAGGHGVGDAHLRGHGLARLVHGAVLPLHRVGEHVVLAHEHAVGALGGGAVGGERHIDVLLHLVALPGVGEPLTCRDDVADLEVAVVVGADNHGALEHGGVVGDERVVALVALLGHDLPAPHGVVAHLGERHGVCEVHTALGVIGAGARVGVLLTRLGVDGVGEAVGGRVDVGGLDGELERELAGLKARLAAARKDLRHELRGEHEGAGRPGVDVARLAGLVRHDVAVGRGGTLRPAGGRGLGHGVVRALRQVGDGDGAAGLEGDGAARANGALDGRGAVERACVLVGALERLDGAGSGVGVAELHRELELVVGQLGPGLTLIDGLADDEVAGLEGVHHGVRGALDLESGGARDADIGRVLELGAWDDLGGCGTGPVPHGRLGDLRTEGDGARGAGKHGVADAAGAVEGADGDGEGLRHARALGRALHGGAHAALADGDPRVAGKARHARPVHAHAGRQGVADGDDRLAGHALLVHRVVDPADGVPHVPAHLDGLAVDAHLARGGGAGMDFLRHLGRRERVGEARREVVNGRGDGRAGVVAQLRHGGARLELALAGVGDAHDHAVAGLGVLERRARGRGARLGDDVGVLAHLGVGDVAEAASVGVDRAVGARGLADGDPAGGGHGDGGL